MVLLASLRARSILLVLLAGSIIGESLAAERKRSLLSLIKESTAKPKVHPVEETKTEAETHPLTQELVLETTQQIVDKEAGLPRNHRLFPRKASHTIVPYVGDDKKGNDADGAAEIANQGLTDGAIEESLPAKVPQAGDDTGGSAEAGAQLLKSVSTESISSTSSCLVPMTALLLSRVQEKLALDIVSDDPNAPYSMRKVMLALFNFASTSVAETKQPELSALDAATLLDVVLARFGHGDARMRFAMSESITSNGPDWKVNGAIESVCHEAIGIICDLLTHRDDFLSEMAIKAFPKRNLTCESSIHLFDNRRFDLRHEIIRYITWHVLEPKLQQLSCLREVPIEGKATGEDGLQHDGLLPAPPIDMDAIKKAATIIEHLTKVLRGSAVPPPMRAIQSVILLSLTAAAKVKDIQSRTCEDVFLAITRIMSPLPSLVRLGLVEGSNFEPLSQIIIMVLSETAPDAIWPKVATLNSLLEIKDFLSIAAFRLSPVFRLLRREGICSKLATLGVSRELYEKTFRAFACSE